MSKGKVNNIYNQCVIFAMIAGALSVPFISFAKTKQSKKPSVIARQADMHEKSASAPLSITPITANVLAQLQPGQRTVQAQSSLTHAGLGNIQGQLDTAGITAVHGTVVITPTPIVVASVIHVPVKQQAKTHAPVSDGQISIQNTKIDNNFIDEMEGVDLKGSVPLPKTTQSGVTIASGFDLGQMPVQEFNTLPISSNLKAKLRPYVGLRRFQAVDFLRSHPLTINLSECHELDRIAANKILRPLVKSYNKSSKVSFLDLPPQAQTALFSFAYQYGPWFMDKGSARELWHYYVSQNWSAVSKTLRNQRMYASRRREEAKLVNQLV